jgi:hypothetical protein
LEKDLFWELKFAYEVSIAVVGSPTTKSHHMEACMPSSKQCNNNEGLSVLPGNYDAVLTSDGNTPGALMVPWGFYFLATQGHTPVPRVVGTTSLNSCFAYIRRWNNGLSLFFAHVSNDGETKHIINNIDHSVPAIGLSSIIITGANPQPTTVNRINSVILATNKNHVVLRAVSGHCSYTVATGIVACHDGIARTNGGEVDEKKALFRDIRLPLGHVAGSEQLENADGGTATITKTGGGVKLVSKV